MNKKTYYKYKSFDNLEFLLDILLLERLYASHFRELNDPMEGIIRLRGDITSDIIQKWEHNLEENRICCFTTDAENKLMWAHYADGGRGCVIEFELPNEYKAQEINYSQKPRLNKAVLNETTAKEILFYKDRCWKYENEYRCISRERYIPIKVKKIIFGPRVSNDRMQLLTGILSCCKPDLQIEIIKGNGDSVFEQTHFTARLGQTYFLNGKTYDDCHDCLRLDSYRKQLLGHNRNNS